MRRVYGILLLAAVLSGMEAECWAASGPVRWGRSYGALIGVSPGGVQYSVRHGAVDFVVEAEKDGYRKELGHFSDEYTAVADVRLHVADYDSMVGTAASLAHPQNVADLGDGARAIPADGGMSGGDNATQSHKPVPLVPEAGGARALTDGNAPSVPSAGNAPSIPAGGNAPSVPAGGNAPSVPAGGNAPSVPAGGDSGGPGSAAAVPEPVVEADAAEELRDWTIHKGGTLESVLREAAAQVGYEVEYQAKEIPVDASALVRHVNFYQFVDDVAGAFYIHPFPQVSVMKGNRYVVVVPAGDR